MLASDISEQLLNKKSKFKGDDLCLQAERPGFFGGV
jgi:hypothetical protein